jgi:hypothetical protein
VLRDRGGLAYVVDVRSGRVRPLVSGVSLKYHTPGCGRSGRAVLTSNPGRDQRATDVLVADLAKARIVRRARVRGQLTSAVPTSEGVTAVQGRSLVRLDGDRRPRPLRRFPGQPYQLRPAARGVDLLVARGRSAEAWNHRAGASRRFAAGRLGTLRLFAGRGGRTVVVGADRMRQSIGARRRATAPPATQAESASLDGGVVVSPPTKATARPPAGQAATSAVSLAPRLSTMSGRVLPRRMPSAAARASKAEPKAAASPTARSAANTTTPKCAVPRNDLRRQVQQPNAAQVNWAIQQATRNLLKGSVLTRPANFANMGLASYQPSNDFARGELRGNSGKPVPPSVIQAVFAQESAWLHASRRALPGLSSNPSISDYYGAGGTIDRINYDQADCGYGVSQVTDYMSAASTYLSPNGKAKVAVDYAENVAVGITFLVNKWNELYDAQMLVNNGDANKLENWYFAAWAYNSGLHPDTGSGPWGLGWTNNPQNSDYPPDREGFLRETYADAARPGDWPYQERVIGWMETPLLNYRGRPSYAAPLGQDVPTRLQTPGYSRFCTTANECSPNHHTGDGRDFCMRADRKCWWHSAVQFADCSMECSHSQFTVGAGDTEPAHDTNYAPACSSTLGANAVIVDDQPSNLNVEGCGASNWTSQGTFSWTYGRDGAGTQLGQIDWHQLGTGFGGHTWFTKNQRPVDTAHINVGTWTPPTPNGIYNIKAHIPVNGASTSNARYVVHRGDGTTSERLIDQHLHQNRWVSLGNFTLQAGAKVVLDNVTPEPDERHNVAFDALAFERVQGATVRRTFDALGVFDENQRLVTTPPPGSSAFIDPWASHEQLYDWAMNLTGDVTADNVCPPHTPKSISCVGAATHAAYTRWRNRVVAAGREHRSPPLSDTTARWLNFHNPDPPQVLPAGYVENRDNAKIRSQLKVEFLQAGGLIDPASVAVQFEGRTGDTHLAEFILDIMRAYRDDYGIAMPDLSYSALDLNRYTHTSTAANPALDGRMPGRQFMYKVSQPVLTDGGQCVRVKSISGGTKGDKPLVLNAAVRNAAQDWRDRVRALDDSAVAPTALEAGADAIFREFFQDATVPDPHSPWHFAPPIWIQQDARFCADGSVIQGGNGQIAESGYMPDLYLYVDQQRVGLTGSSASGPAQTGDFARFVNAPTYLNVWNDRNPWNHCRTDATDAAFVDRRDGNPWRLQFDTNEDETPTQVRLCDTLVTDDPGELHTDP